MCMYICSGRDMISFVSAVLFVGYVEIIADITVEAVIVFLAVIVVPSANAIVVSVAVTFVSVNFVVATVEIVFSV